MANVLGVVRDWTRNLLRHSSRDQRHEAILVWAAMDAAGCFGDCHEGIQILIMGYDQDDESDHEVLLGALAQYYPPVLVADFVEDLVHDYIHLGMASSFIGPHFFNTMIPHAGEGWKDDIHQAMLGAGMSFEQKLSAMEILLCTGSRARSIEKGYLQHLPPLLDFCGDDDEFELVVKIVASWSWEELQDIHGALEKTYCLAVDQHCWQTVLRMMPFLLQQPRILLLRNVFLVFWMCPSMAGIRDTVHEVIDAVLAHDSEWYGNHQVFIEQILANLPETSQEA